MKKVVAFLLFSTLAFAVPENAKLKKSYRFERDQWIYVHLEGTPSEIGYQHGYLLASEIEDALNSVRFEDTRRTKRDWGFFRQTAQQILWPHIDAEYQQELQGIADGLNAKGVKLDVYDIVALNAFEEVPDYYVPLLDKAQARLDAPKLVSPGNCSAFVATGSYTKDHKIVIAHNNWTGFVPGARWRIIFDISPKSGHHLIMDGFPGVIASDDDFGVNDAGIMITETTISGFHGFDPNGKPEFMRARRAMQYASSIDEYVKIMLDGNNGGYANDWLLGDRKTGEVAQFELGLKHWKLWRTKDGYFVGSNWARDPDVLKDETDFDSSDMSSSPNARRVRWEQLMAQYKGQIDTKLAEQFLGDHFDTYEKKEDPNERTLCGHVENSPRGVPVWERPPYSADGAVQGKAMDSTLASSMSFYARRGHPCGTDFIASTFLEKHPEFEWQKPVLTDMKAGPWSLFKPGEKQ